MAERLYEDPVLELTRRLSGDAVDTYELAAEMSDDEAEIVLEVLDEVEAEEKAASIAARLRQQGHVL